MELFVDDSLEESLENQYIKLREAYSICEKVNDLETMYAIKENLGSGYIKIYKLKGDLSIVIYNIEFLEEISTNYNLSKNYFEIEYCLEGSMDICQKRDDILTLIEGEISISKDRPMNGKIIYRKNNPYKGISIAGDTDSISEYFGVIGKEFWNETIGILDEKAREKYYRGIKISPDISNVFLDIFSVDMPYKGKTIYLESKVMELLSILASYEIQEKTTDIKLEDYEIEKIKKVPSILMENIFDPPSIEKLSKELSINRNKLNEGFKLIFNDTIYNNHRTMCLEKSKVYLKNTNKSISDIAFDIGYSSPSNYIYAFKRKYKMTPNEYRKDIK